MQYHLVLYMFYIKSIYLITALPNAKSMAFFAFTSCPGIFSSPSLSGFQLPIHIVNKLDISFSISSSVASDFFNFRNPLSRPFSFQLSSILCHLSFGLIYIFLTLKDTCQFKPLCDSCISISLIIL